MRLPVKDRDTIPWMTQREIPAIKAVLSAWRKGRKDPDFIDIAQTIVNDYFRGHGDANITATLAARELEELAIFDERLRKEEKEAHDAKAKA